MAGPPPLASLSELIATTPGGIEENELERARIVLRQASSLVRDACRRPTGWFDVDTDPLREGAAWVENDPELPLDVIGVPERIWAITLQVAKREMLHGEGHQAETRSLGDYSRTVAHDTSGGGGKDGVWLTAAERADVEQYAPENTAGAGVINLGLSTAYRRAMRPSYGGYC